MEIVHFSHQHPLLPCVQQQSDEARCYACCLPIQGPMYSCSHCRYFLHRSCAHLPQQIQHHPFHLPHPLTLLAKSPYHDWGRFICRGCGKFCSGFVFHCAECYFDLDIECARLMPTFKYESHEHPLALFKHAACYQKCNACRTLCNGIIFRCVPCNFNLHIHCSPFPLPHNIKHKCHVHPLALTNSIVQDDFDEFYCDACEKHRNPEHPIYYCVECDYIVQIECAISELLTSLREETYLTAQIGDMKLDTSRIEDRKVASEVPKEALAEEGVEQEQESDAEEKVGETKLASLLGAFLGFTAQDIAMAIRVFESMASENVGAELAADPGLAELSEGIEMLRLEIQTLAEKLKALMRKRLQQVCNVDLEAGCLREGQTANMQRNQHRVCYLLPS